MDTRDTCGHGEQCGQTAVSSGRQSQGVHQVSTHYTARDVAHCDAKYNNWVTVVIVKIMKFKTDISLANTGLFKKEQKST